MCYVRDGKAHTQCLDISPEIARDATAFRNALVNIITELAGTRYAAEIRDNLTLVDVVAEFSSFDDRIHVTVRNLATGVLGASN